MSTLTQRLSFGEKRVFLALFFCVPKNTLPTKQPEKVNVTTLKTPDDSIFEPSMIKPTVKRSVVITAAVMSPV